MSLVRSVMTVGSLTLGSRVFGFVRDILIAAGLGAGPLADAFFVAFRLPNMFRRLFAEGAFAAAFVPLFNRLAETEGRDAAERFAEDALSVLLWTLVAAIVLGQIAMPGLMMVFAPGFLAEPETFAVAVELSRITFPYLLFISLVSLLGGVLNSLGRFAAAAASPILLNLVLIGAILVAAPFFPSPAHALAWGVAVAGVVQFVGLVVSCRSAGLPLRLRPPRFDAHIKLLLRRILPLAVGAGVYQINLMIDVILGSFLPAGAISFLYFADRVNQLPLGVVGVAIGTALLPQLSREIRAGRDGHHSQNRAMELSLLLALPSSVALALLAHPIISILFERGLFGATEASLTADALAAFAWGLPAYVLVKTLSAGFFAREDTSTPVKIAGVALAGNVALNLALIGPFQHVGIAAATAASGWINASLLGWILYRRGHLVFDSQLIARLPRIVAATVGMAVIVVGLRCGFEGIMVGGTISRAIGLAAIIAAGGFGYVGLAFLFKAATRNDFRSLGRRKSATPIA